MKREPKPSIGLFLGRPDRFERLGQELRALGFRAIQYDSTRQAQDAVPVSGGFLRALGHALLRTDHDVYLGGLCFAPTLCLEWNRILRGRPYVFNLTAAMWEMFHDRARGRPLQGLLEHQVYPFLFERILAGASRIVCNSRFLQEEVVRHHPRHRYRLTTIHNGIDFDRFGPRERRWSGENGGEAVLACVTSLNYRNKAAALELVLDAFSSIREGDRRVRLVVAAKTSNDTYRRRAEESVACHPFRNSISLQFNERNVPELLAQADLFLFATPNDSNDSLPRVLLEAQASGLPVVTTATSGCPEIVLDGETGYTVAYDSTALASRSRQLLESPDLRRSFGQHAAEHVRNAFSWRRMAERYGDVCTEVGGRSALRRVLAPAEAGFSG